MTPDTPPPIAIVAEQNASDDSQFVFREIDTPDGPRRYKVYVPRSYDKSKPSPLVVMLHGCTQDPDNIARGTRFNEVAESAHFIVVYPEQPQKANGLKCWNWFDPAHQKRDKGEPALIAAITHSVIDDYNIDKRRVYIAGVSAGGAMALTVAYAYPELFAAAGIHSGIAYGAVGTIAEAVTAMHAGAPIPSQLSEQVIRGMGSRRSFPAIVFQGGADKSVAAINADQVVSQLTGLFEYPLTKLSESSAIAPGDYHVTKRTYGKGRALLEEWIVDELAHAWSGGSKDGTYTDVNGPDATREMVRFFFEHPRS